MGHGGLAGRRRSWGGWAAREGAGGALEADLLEAVALALPAGLVGEAFW